MVKNTVNRARTVAFETLEPRLLLDGGLAAMGMSSVKCLDLTATAGLIQLEYDMPALQMEQVGAGEAGPLSQVVMGDVKLTGGTGQVLLPSVTAKVVIPYGYEVADVLVETGERFVLDGQYTLTEGDMLVASDGLTTASMEWIDRSNGYEVVGVQGWRGVDILVLNFYPVEYSSQAGTLSYFDSLELSVQLTPSDSSSGQSQDIVYRADPFGTLSDQVDNPAALATYEAAGGDMSGGGWVNPADTYRYVVITNAALANASADYDMADFIAHKQSLGYTARVVTVEDIYANYTGADQQAKIRNFIIDAYNGWETDFVLLAGDSSVIPLRKLLVPGNSPDLIDSDMYYQGLDGSFNADGDGYYGEYSGDNPDYISDVYLGRAPFADVTKMSNWVYKTIAYDNSLQDSYHYNALMVGEVLDGATDSKPSLEYIRTSCFNRDPAFQVYKLYDSEQAWSSSDIIAKMNSNTYAVYNHLGHANGGIVMKTGQDTYDAQLTNTKFFFAYSQGCWPGYLGPGGSVAEHLTTHTRHGAAAGMFNSTYGWYYSGTSGGPSQDLNVQFWDAMFGEGMNQIGAMNADSHADNMGHIGTWYYQAVIYGTTIFGDPSLEIVSYDVQVKNVNLGVAYQRQPYSATLETVHGTGPFSWAVVAGALPDGLTLDSDTGVISGTPTKRGDFTFTVQVTDAVLDTATRQFSLNVGHAPNQFVGQVFLDLDADGQRDANERGLNGWTVQLLNAATGAVVATTVSASSDLNGDGSIDPKSETGMYFFTGVSPGDYQIRQTLQSGFAPTTFHQPASRSFAVGTTAGVTRILEFSPLTGVTLNSFNAPQPIQTGGLQGLAVGPNSLFYVDSVNMLSPVVWEFDMNTGAVLDSDALTFGLIYSIQGAAYCGGSLFIQYLPGKIAVWNPVTDSFVREITVAGDISGGLTGADDLGLLYASNSAGQILAISPANGAILSTLNPGVGSLNGGLAYCDGSLIGVASTSTIARRMNRITGAVLNTYAINEGFGLVSALGGDAKPALVGGILGVTMASGQYLEVGGLGDRWLGVPGDMDADTDVDAMDIDLLRTNFGGAGVHPRFDLDGDADADAADVDVLIHDVLNTEYADFNLDGQVDATDLALLAGGFGGAGGWATGDADGDAMVTATDLALLGAHYGYVRPEAPSAPDGGGGQPMTLGESEAMTPVEFQPVVESDVDVLIQDIADMEYADVSADGPAGVTDVVESQPMVESDVDVVIQDVADTEYADVSVDGPAGVTDVVESQPMVESDVDVVIQDVADTEYADVRLDLCVNTMDLILLPRGLGPVGGVFNGDAIRTIAQPASDSPMVTGLAAFEATVVPPMASKAAVGVSALTVEEQLMIDVPPVLRHQEQGDALVSPTSPAERTPVMPTGTPELTIPIQPMVVAAGSATGHPLTPVAELELTLTLDVLEEVVPLAL